MLFHSLEFLVFLPVVFGIYWAAGHRAQNILILAASYVFYGWWDWRFLSLLAWSSFVDYRVGLRLAVAQQPRARKVLLGISLATNLGLLGVFKYYNFFVASLAEALTSVGIQPNVPTLSIILPVGISFYTFQTLSYTIDVYRRQCEPHHDAIEFFAFVSFFPQLVAGPIERARNLLGQFQLPRTFDNTAAADGLRQMLWGFFKKVVVADTLALAVDDAYGGGQDGLSLVLATVFFAFQIYCDFSGYSDIAVGCARLFGFRLMRNFAYPYFASGMADFWRRWHISLSTWFGDYVYIPLGGNRHGGVRWIRNIFVTFMLSGLWHGARWTFVAWGFLHALYYLPGIAARRLPTVRLSTAAAAMVHLGSVALTFGAVCFAWIFFRADSLGHAFHLIHSMATGTWKLSSLGWAGTRPLALIAVLTVVEFLQRNKQHPLELPKWPAWGRWTAYYAVLGAILLLGRLGGTPFIYFQF